MELIRVMQEEVTTEIEELGKMKLGSEEHVKTAEVVTKLCDRIIELKKFELDVNKATDDVDAKTTSLRIEAEKAKFEKHDARVKNGIAVGTTILTLGVTVGATIYSWIKEDGGTMTFTAGKEAMRSLLKFRK